MMRMDGSKDGEIEKCGKEEKEWVGVGGGEGVGGVRENTLHIQRGGGRHV